MVLLLQILVSKINGQKNAKNNNKVVIFFVSLAASGNGKAYEFIYVNVDGITFLQSQLNIFQKAFPDIHRFLEATYCSKYHLKSPQNTLQHS